MTTQQQQQPIDSQDADFSGKWRLAADVSAELGEDVLLIESIQKHDFGRAEAPRPISSIDPVDANGERIVPTVAAYVPMIRVRASDVAEYAAARGAAA